MYRRTKKLFAAALVLTMLLTMTVFQGLASAATTTTRLGGNNRYETAAKIATEGWASGAATVVLVRGDESADALVAAPLAKLNDAPILLTASNELSAATKTALTALKATKVIIVGGTKAVSDAVKTAIEAMNITVSRVSGDSRYETSVNVAKELGTFTEVALANAYAPADALSVSAIAAAKGMPILFTDKASLPKAVSDFLAGKTVKAYLIGGTGVVSDAVYAGATRLGGNDRYATNREVLKGFADVKYDKVFLATSEGADALTGSALAAKTFSPIVLVDKTFDAATLTFVAEKATTSASVVALGGATVVTDEAVATLSAAINNAKFQVTEVKAINATQLMVKFNKPVDKTDAEKTAKYSIGTVNPASAALQADKVSVLLTMGSVMSGTKLYVVDPILLADSTTVKTPIFTYVETYSDTVAPRVISVTYPTFDTAKVTFSEPIKNFGTVTITQNGAALTTLTTSLNADETELTYGLASAAADKAITVAYVGTTDKADNLISPNPTVVTLTKVSANADKVKPYVVEAKALSNKRISLTFSEKLGTAPVTVTANGQVVTLSTSDSITYTGDMANAVAGIGRINVSGDYKDVAGNTGDAYTSALLQFTADTTAPKLVSSEVKVIDSVTYLVLHFNEDVTAVGGSISGTRVKDYVTSTFPATAALVSGVANDAKSVKVDISSDTLYPAGVYTVTIPTGFVKDTAVPTAFGSEAATVSFTKVISAAADTTKPVVSSVTFADDNSYVDVVFSKTMDYATALNYTNYAVGGVCIFKAATFFENAKTVRLVVIPGTILYNGNYAFTIKAVKDSAGNAMANDYYAPTTVRENIAPYLASAVMTAGNTVVVTFSENVTVAANAVEVYVNGTKVAATSAAGTTTDKTLTVTLGTAITELGKTIQVKLVDATAEDVNGNLAVTGTLVPVTLQ